MNSIKCLKHFVETCYGTGVLIAVKSVVFGKVHVGFVVWVVGRTRYLFIFLKMKGLADSRD